MTPTWTTLPNGTYELSPGGVVQLDQTAAERLRQMHRRWRHLTEPESARAGIPEAWTVGTMWVESRGNPDATSPAGAVGLMQLMPQFYAGNEGRRLYDPATNVRLGCETLAKYRSKGLDLVEAYSCYNAGPGRDGRPKKSPSKPFGLAHDPPAIEMVLRAHNTFLRSQPPATSAAGAGIPLALLAGAWWLFTSKG